MAQQHHKATFERIAEEKRTRILDVATIEFANKGFTSANINVIADKAGVSVGSLYKYFDTKEDFFLATVHRGVVQLETILDEVLSQEGDLFAKIEKILRIIQKHSRANADIINLYNEMTSEANSTLTRRLSRELETISAKTYKALIKQAKDDGEIGSDVDEGYLAFFLDNLFLTLQFSYASEYYKERMKIYLGSRSASNDEQTRTALLTLLKGAFRSLS